MDILFKGLLAVAALGVWSVHAEAEEPCYVSESSKVADLDFLTDVVRTPETAADIFAFAYGAGCRIEVSRMTGNADDPSSWTPVEGKTKVLPTGEEEGTVIWDPSGSYLFRAKLTDGDGTAVADFDLRGTQGIRIPAEELVVTPSSIEMIYTMRSVRPTFTIRNEQGETLVEGVDYTLSYSDDVNVGTCIVTVTGIGGYKGTAYTQYRIVYPPVSVAEPVKCNLDLRDDELLVCDLKRKMFAVSWNSTADWTAGGDDSTVDVTYIPLDGPEAEADVSRRQVLFSRSGEGAVKACPNATWVLMEHGDLRRRMKIVRSRIVIIVR